MIPKIERRTVEFRVDDVPDEAEATAKPVIRGHAAVWDSESEPIMGMFREKIEVSGPNGGPIQTQNAIEVSLLAKEERDMLRQILLVAAERKAERERQEMKTIEHQKGE